MTNYNNQGRQTELVKCAIINYIKDHRLNPGDHIPTQAQLRTMLDVSNSVIGRATKALADDGILESRGRHGVVVLNPSADGYLGRNIGIICHRDTEYAVSAVLLKSLGIILNERACQITFFNKDSSERKDRFSLSEFSGALKAVERKQISGLFSTMLLDDGSVKFCEENNVPLVYAGVMTPNAASVDAEIKMEDFFRYVRRKGYKRPMYIHMGHPVTERLRNEFLQLVEKYGFPVGKDKEKYCRFIREDGKSSWDLECNMNKVLELIREVGQWSAGERPDVLIIPDDMIATWAAQVISQTSWDAEIVHIEILQLGYSWPLRGRGSYFRLDCDEFARLAVDSLLGIIQGRKPGSKISYVPEFIERRSSAAAETKKPRRKS